MFQTMNLLLLIAIIYGICSYLINSIKSKKQQNRMLAEILERMDMIEKKL